MVTPKVSGGRTPVLSLAGSSGEPMDARCLLAAGFTLHVPIVLVHLRRAVAIATLQSDLPNFSLLSLPSPQKTFGPAPLAALPTSREEDEGWRRPWPLGWGA